MKRTVTTWFVVAGLLAASSAMALDLQQRVPVSFGARATRPAMATALGCDNGTPYNAYFQSTDSRFGNYFDFGTSSLLSAVSFEHYGFDVAGPYDYDIEIWDPASCTMVASRDGLVAADAGTVIQAEYVDLCSSSFLLSGYMLVMIDPNTCVTASDCYPDLLFDDQTGVLCPAVIGTATTAANCVDVSAQTGPFLLRVDINGCATPARRGSWGELKSSYR